MKEDETESELAPPSSIEEFIISNYQIFTVIGVLGGLSVYLAQLSEELPFPRYGIAGSLLMFLIFSSVALKNGMIAAVRARSYSGIMSYFLYFCYLGVVVGIAGIMITITVLLATHFPTGTGKLLGWIILQFFTVVYFGFIFNVKYIAEYEGKTRFRYIIRYSPHISVLLIITWVISVFHQSNPPEHLSILFSGNMPEQMGTIFGLGVVHITYTILIIIPFFFLDRFMPVLEECVFSLNR